MRGVLFAVAAYAIWGCFPLYFSLLSGVNSLLVLAFRILFACLFSAGLVMLLQEKGGLLRLLSQRRILVWSLLASILISINWFVFIWAVAQQRVLETSLGYFITPLVSLLLGWLALNERVNRFQAVAGVVAAIAILFEVITLGGLPWVSLVLAFSFGLYGLVRKLQPIESLPGLLLETLWMLLPALWLIGTASGAELKLLSAQQWLLLVLSGVVTAVPLLLFAASVRRINLIVAGFIMYLNPLMQFVTAVWLLNEPVYPQRYVTFVLVWLAMAIFIWGLIRKARQEQTSVKKTKTPG